MPFRTPEELDEFQKNLKKAQEWVEHALSIINKSNDARFKDIELKGDPMKLGVTGFLDIYQNEEPEGYLKKLEQSTENRNGTLDTFKEHMETIASFSSSKTLNEKDKFALQMHKSSLENLQEILQRDIKTTLINKLKSEKSLETHTDQAPALAAVVALKTKDLTSETVPAPAPESDSDSEPEPEPEPGLIVTAAPAESVPAPAAPAESATAESATAPSPSEAPAPAVSTAREKIFNEAVCRDKNGVLQSNGVSIDDETRTEILAQFTLGTDDRALKEMVEQGMKSAQLMLDDKSINAFGSNRAKSLEIIRSLTHASNVRTSDSEKVKAHYQLLAAALISEIKEYEAQIQDPKNKNVLDKYDQDLKQYQEDLVEYQKQKNDNSDFSTKSQLELLQEPTKPKPPITTTNGVNADTLHNFYQSAAAFTSFAQMANIQKSLSENGLGVFADPNEPYKLANVLFGEEGDPVSGDKHKASAYNCSEAVMKKLSESVIAGEIKKLQEQLEQLKSGTGTLDEQKKQEILKKIEEKEKEKKDYIERLKAEAQALARKTYKPLKGNGMSGGLAISNKSTFDYLMGAIRLKWSGTENAQHIKNKMNGITFGHKRGIRHEIGEDGSVTSFFTGLSRREIQLGRPRTMSKLTKQLSQVYGLSLSFGGSGSSPENPITFGEMDPPEGKAVQLSALLIAVKNSGRTSYVKHEGVIYEVPADAMTRDLSTIYAVDEKGDRLKNEPPKTLQDLSDYCSRVLNQPATSVDGKPMLSLVHTRFQQTMKIQLQDEKGQKRSQNLFMALRDINTAMERENPSRKITYDQLMAMAVDGGSLTYGNPKQTVAIFPTSRSFGLNTWRTSFFKDKKNLEDQKNKAFEKSGVVETSLKKSKVSDSGPNEPQLSQFKDSAASLVEESVTDNHNSEKFIKLSDSKLGDSSSTDTDDDLSTGMKNKA